jgi:cation diffusion facilitator family transporter
MVPLLSTQAALAYADSPVANQPRISTAALKGLPIVDARHLVMAISLAVSIVMLIGKLTAYFLTGSSAVLADASESVVHLVATSFAAFSLWYAAQPADANHPYGHGRIAFFSAGFEGGLVFIASLAVIASGVVELIRGPELQRLGVGLLLTSALALINLLLGIALIAVGRRHQSMVLIANGRHVLTDVYTTAAAIVGLGLVILTGREILDPLAAILIGGLIMLGGYNLIRSAVAGLMDEMDPEFKRRMDQALAKRAEDSPIGEIHEVRARQINDEIWLEMHVLMRGSTTILDAHAAVTQFENELRSDFPEYRLRINSHIEPLDHARDHPKGHPS